MNNTIFSKSFNFDIFEFKKFHLTDNTKIPLKKHYIGCIITGHSKIISKKQKLELKPNEVFYIPKGLRYQSHWFADKDEYVAFYSFAFDFLPVNNTYVLQKIKCTEKAKQIFDELCLDLSVNAKSIGKLYDFFGEIAESLKQAKNPKANPIIEKAMEYMWENTDFKISDVAKYCNISTSGIFHIFKTHLNKTPNQVRLEILCERAVLLLTTTDKSVEEISESLNFSSTSYFRKILHKNIGMTPREIRKSAENI